MNPFYSSTTLSSSTSELNNFNNLNNLSEPLSPRALYAQSFDRPSSARSLPSSKRFRKNMKEMTGFGTTEEEFEALPIAVRRKVRRDILYYQVSIAGHLLVVAAAAWQVRLVNSSPSARMLSDRNARNNSIAASFSSPE
jgi:hypothetical protein